MNYLTPILIGALTAIAASAVKGLAPLLVQAFRKDLEKKLTLRVGNKTLETISVSADTGEAEIISIMNNAIRYQEDTLQGLQAYAKDRGLSVVDSNRTGVDYLLSSPSGSYVGIEAKSRIHGDISKDLEDMFDRNPNLKFLIVRAQGGRGTQPNRYDLDKVADKKVQIINEPIGSYEALYRTLDDVLSVKTSSVP